MVISIVISCVLLLLIPTIVTWLKNKYQNFNYNTYNVITIITITLLSTFIGAFSAIQLTIGENTKTEKENYISLLESSIKEDQHNKHVAEILIGNKNYNFYKYNSIENLNQQIVLRKIIENGNIYKYSSNQLKNWLPFLTFSEIYSYKLLYEFLTFKEKILNAEIQFKKDSLSEKELDDIYKNALGPFSLKDTTYEKILDTLRSSNLLRKLASSINDSLIYEELSDSSF